MQNQKDKTKNQEHKTQKLVGVVPERGGDENPAVM